MLQIKDVVKNYGDKENVVKALKGVSLNFRKSEFVSILGQSGCGKTTLLNIIGGLDRYTSGDLVIDNISTKNYKDVDWDTYRNVRIGFIFQSYNLISHINILSNVEMALTLSGISAQERKERAIKVLQDVGLGDQLHKRPNQMSGGQMQRVSIARALINNPDIILADEPTGALDSNTSVQIMDMLKEIAKDRLVIMVTHNRELAEEYSTRIISLKDGLIIDDTNPFYMEEQKNIIDAPVEDEEVVEGEVDLHSEEHKEAVAVSKKQERARIKAKKKKLAKTSMSFITAIKLSFNNLMTKKGRTILTAIAASIGIIGVSLVLAISNGFSRYIDKMQTDMLAGYPIQVTSEYYDMEALMNYMQGGMNGTKDEAPKFPTDGKVSTSIINTDAAMQISKKNNITQEYIDYVNKMDKSLYGSITYSYAMNTPVIGIISESFINKPAKVPASSIGGFPTGKYKDGTNKDIYLSGKENPDSLYQQVNDTTLSIGWKEITGKEDFINKQYDLMAGRFPKEKHELILIIDETNRILEPVSGGLGLDINKSYALDKLLSVINEQPLKIYTNDEYYIKNDKNLYVPQDYETLYNDTTKGIELEIVGIYRQREDVTYTTMGSGVFYLNELTQYMLQQNLNSEIVQAQKANNTHNVLTGKKLGANIGVLSFVVGQEPTQEAVIASLGGSDVPNSISIYPINFEAKEQITAYLDKWNQMQPTDATKVEYTDMAALIASMLSQMIKIITIALTCFSAVSLFVSSFMIGIITYVSVVERTKEIGILRALGARRKDISRVFNAETGIVGFTAGVIGVLITYILHLPINLLVNHFAGMTLNICFLNPLTALAMIALSMALTLIAGIFPSRIAAKKDPVLALAATN